MNSVDQKRAEAAALLARSPALFRRQGAVVATWRRSDGRAHGPYYSLRYRDEGRQRSHYLGRSADLAAAVRNLLARLQRPRRMALHFAKLRATVQQSLRRQKQALRAQLERELGLTLKGFEVRKLRRPTTEPLLAPLRIVLSAPSGAVPGRRGARNRRRDAA